MLPAPISAPVSNDSGWGLNRFVKTALSAATAIGGGALVTLSDNPASLVAGSLMIGAGIQGVIYTTAQEVTTAVHKVSQTIFGQFAFFTAEQVYANSENSTVQSLSLTFMGAIAGANLIVYGRRLYESRWVISVESDARSLLNGAPPARTRTLAYLFYSSRVRRVCSLVFGIILCAPSFFPVDEVFQGVSRFFAAYYVFFSAGDLAEGLIENYRIRLAGDSDSSPEATALRFRVNATATVYLVLGVPLLFCPFREGAHTAARIAQLPILGIFAGFGEGYINASHTQTLRHTPIDQVPELQNIRMEEHQRYDAWRKLTAGTFVTALTGFTIWQEGWDLVSTMNRVGLATLYLSFHTVLGMGFFADHWSLRDNANLPVGTVEKVREKAICWFASDARILGVHPAIFAMVVENAMQVNDVAIDQQRLSHQILSVAQWGAYGAAMGVEVLEGLLPRNLPWLKRLVLINSALTLRRRALAML